MGDTGKTTGVASPISSRGEVRNLWLNFAEETTFHACKNIANREKSVFARLWWGCIFFGMIFGLVYILGGLLASYKKYPTITRSSVEYLSSMDYPTITFCNANGFDKTKSDNSVLNDFMAHTSPILKELMPVNLSYTNPWLNETHYLQYRKMSFSKEDQLVLALLDGSRLDQEMFDEVDGSTGMCFRLNSEEMIRRHGAQKTRAVGLGGAVEFLLNIHQDKSYPGPHTHAGMQLFINHPSYRQTHLDSLISVAPGTTTFISLTKTKYKFLPRPYKSFGSDTCLETDSDDFRNPLRYHPTYSWGACLDECYVDLVASKCECKVLKDPDELDLPYCTIRQVAECGLPEYSTVYVNTTSQREICDCKKPCTFYMYDTKLSQGVFPSMAAADYMLKNKFINSSEYARQNLVNIKIYYEQLILNSVEHEAMYTLGSIIGTLGGQMGFFLGASAITLYEVFEVCLHTVKARVKRWVAQKQTRTPVLNMKDTSRT